MLTLVEIRKATDSTFNVIIDRDGQTLQYVFDIGWAPDGRIAGASEPDQMYADLLDYELISRGPSRGAFNIPAIRRVRRLVYRFATGQPVDLPEMLDPR